MVLIFIEYRFKTLQETTSNELRNYSKSELELRDVCTTQIIERKIIRWEKLLSWEELNSRVSFLAHETRSFSDWVTMPRKNPRRENNWAIVQKGTNEAEGLTLIPHEQRQFVKSERVMTRLHHDRQSRGKVGNGYHCHPRHNR